MLVSLLDLGLQVIKHFDDWIHIKFLGTLLTENAFGSFSPVLLELQRPTIPHFKGNLVINNFVAYSEDIWVKT